MLFGRSLYFTLIIFSVLFTAGCAYKSSTNKTAVGIERKQFMMLSSSQMDQSSKQAYSRVVTEAKKKQLFNKDSKTVKRLKGILNNLIPHTAVFRNDAVNWKWEVNLLKSKELNAWCMPGGKMMFYSGLVEKLNLNDAQIAAIMGHEMGHALREHSREKVSRSLAAQLTLSIATSALGLQIDISSIANEILDVTFNLPNSREAEREADRIGVELAARAGYDPKEAVKIWQKMAKLPHANKPEILSTHPVYENRIKDLQKYADLVEPLYINAKK
jgi:Zn-dependent protease with chaperone function